MKPRPIVFLSRCYGNQPQATATRLAAYAAALRELGQQVVVLTRFPFVSAGRPEHESYRGKLFLREEIKGVRIHRYRLPFEDRMQIVFAGSLKTICGWLNVPRIKGMEMVDVAFTLMALPRLLWLRPRLLVLEQGPAWLGVPARVCRWLGIPVVVQVSDIKSEQMRRGQYGKLKPNRIALIERIEASVYACAAEIVTVTKSMQAIISRRAGVPPDRIHWIPNGAELDHISPVEPAERSRSKERLGLAGKFVAVYAGTFGPAHDLERVVEAAKELATTEGGSDVAFLFVGGGAAERDLVNLVREYSLESVRFLPGVPIEELGAYLGAADVGLSPEMGGLGVTLRSKLFAYMAAGIPLIATDDEGEARRLVEQSRCGSLVPPGDTRALVEAILELRNAPDRAWELGKRGRSFGERHHDRRKTAARFAAVAMGAIERAGGSTGPAA